MKYIHKQPAVLLLEDGKVFNGFAAGKIGTTFGEICFNTGMTGYQEIFTDPSYFGQIPVMTNVHIGNYGVFASDVESNSVKIAGMICKSFSEFASRKKSDGNLRDYFEQNNIVAIQGIDTRALVRYIRERGAMNAIISSETLDITHLTQQLSQVPSMAGLELASKVATSTPYFVGEASSPFKVAVIDYGVKQNILRSLVERGCYLQVFPMNTKLETIQQWNPNGIMLSNGPGDPSVMTPQIENIRQFIASGISIFGICLGHQLLAHAAGLNTFKMHKGHRGINHPVKNLKTGKSEITSQNHGFSVDPASIRPELGVEITHVNLNDDSIEGIRLKNANAFSVQYHPESCPGPYDSRYLFDDFVKTFSA